MKVKAVCKNNSMSCQDDFTIGKTYKVKICEDGFYELKDNHGFKWLICQNDFNFNFEVVEKEIEGCRLNIPSHYDNSKGSLYKVAKERGWGAYLFDIVKRLERSEKKGEFKQDLEKSKVVIDLWLNEL